MKKDDNLVILAGGASSRMKKAAVAPEGLSEEEIKQANERNKGLISVSDDGRPMLDYVLYNAKKAGYRNIYIVISEKGGLFKEFYGNRNRDNDFHGLKISYAVQYIPKDRVKPFGTADALYQAVEQYPELNGKSYTVCNSDNLYSVEAYRLLRDSVSPHAFIAYDRDALQFPAERISRFALAKLDTRGHLLDIVEKPEPEKVGLYRDEYGKLRVSMNVFKFDGEQFHPYLKDCPVNPERNEKELPTALMNMLQDYPGTMSGIPCCEHVPDLTSKEDIALMKKYLQEHYGQLNWEAI